MQPHDTMRTDDIAPRVVEVPPRAKRIRYLSLSAIGFAIIVFSYSAVAELLRAIQQFHAPNSGSTWVFHAFFVLIWLGFLIYCLLDFIAKVRTSKPSSGAARQ